MGAIQLPYQWRPRGYQLPAWQYFENGGKRAALVWHRRAGKDLFSINLCATKAFERVGLYWHLFPTYNQGRKIAWEGMTRTGRKFLDHFPEPLVKRKHGTEMLVELANDSIYQVVGTDNIDRLVGSNPVGCIFSEWSLMDPRAWDLIRPILAENGGWACFIYTPRGHNHGYDLINTAEKSDRWFAQRLSVPDTQAISMEAVEDEREAGMPEELIQQEFFCSFEAPLTGAYYGEQLTLARQENRIKTVPYDPALDVHTAWDLGVNDQTSIWFAQVAPPREIRLIDFHTNSGEGLEYYAKLLSEKPYKYGKHFAPHDIKVRDLSTGRSRIEYARKLGLNFTVTPKLSVQDGIQAVRAMLPLCWFDETKCAYGLEALKQYRKEYDDLNKVYKSTPVHDWTSHPADAFRMLALNIRWMLRERNDNLPRSAISDYNEYRPHSSNQRDRRQLQRYY